VTRKFSPTGGSEQNLASFFGAFSAAAFKFLIGIFITPMLLSGSVMAIACHSIPDHQRKLVGLLVSNWQPRFRQAFSALQDVNSCSEQLLLRACSLRFVSFFFLAKRERAQPELL
jgi:hypothetical protein